jgi:predicted PurR-regulated permease PerM
VTRRGKSLLLENFVEPKVMGRPFDTHPLIVLVVTALGGVIGGIVGLILAVPFFAIARNAIAHLRSRGVTELAADRAKPAVRRVLE